VANSGDIAHEKQATTGPHEDAGMDDFRGPPTMSFFRRAIQIRGGNSP